MRAEIAKRNLLNIAIKHYLENSEIMRFMSLQDDNEPYPIEDVIILLSERIARLEREFNQYPNESNKQGLTMATNQLKKLAIIQRKQPK
ncbi:hypothetical protein QV06_03550 [Gallibacterium genomosp. 3]|uniref:Uncharacterized protein n=1 Tax=Gallibacterium genomosp. 3 TaxID=505345 RepID=A0A1A7PU90_9PAST|nr:hypothetical protein [Gallibacterium genomosp. 3]OBX05286.1 hypothetical protein QV06_03550 [Gallibacterium genomosp. 3]